MTDHLSRRPARDDAAAIDRVFRDELLRHLRASLRPEDLAAFLEQVHARGLGGRARRSSAIAFRVAEADGELVGFVKLGPPQLPVETDAGRRSSFASSTSCKSWHGQGAAQAADGLGDRRGESARRATSSTSPSTPTIIARAPLLRTLRLRRGRAATTSWSATRPTRTSSCGQRCERRRSHPRRSLWQACRTASSGGAAASRQASCAGLNVGYGSGDDRAAIAENRRRAIEAVLPGARARDRPPGPFGRRRLRRAARGRRTSGPTPTPWSPTGPACCSASSPPTARRCCSPTQRREWSARRMPAGAARSPASPRRRSRRWSGSGAGASGSPPRSARASRQPSYEVDEAFRERFLDARPGQRALLRRRPCGQAAFRPRRPTSSTACRCRHRQGRGAASRHLCRPRPLLQLPPGDPPRRADYGRQISLIGLPIAS